MATTDLAYHGGPIQRTPRVYLVFWGSQWDTDATNNGAAASYVNKFFHGLGEPMDSWSRVTTQYSGTNGSPTFSTMVLKGVWSDNTTAAPTNASAGDIAREAQRAVGHFNLATSVTSTAANVNVIVMSPHGTHPDGFPNTGFCAWHSNVGNIPFTNMPFVSDVGSRCGGNSVRSKLDGFSIVAGHEYLEAVTDPYPESGWADPYGYENADKCAWKNLHLLKLRTGSFAVQPTWSNSTHMCAG
jgi:serine protease